MKKNIPDRAYASKEKRNDLNSCHNHEQGGEDGPKRNQLTCHTEYDTTDYSSLSSYSSVLLGSSSIPESASIFLTL